MKRFGRYVKVGSAGLALVVFGGCHSSGSGTGANGGSNGAGGSGGGAGTLVGGGKPGGAVATTYPCTGCQAFPPADARTCAAGTLAAPTIAYPPDGVLLPPNMNVLEVQFVPNSDATLFEVDFRNTNTHVAVETTCLPVPDVRGGPSRGCGVTLPQAAWNDIANNNREAEPVEITVRATKDGACVASSAAGSVRVTFAKENLAGGIYYWQSGTFGGIAGTTGGIYSHDFGSVDPTPTPFYTSGATGTCVGCHTVSRDGLRMALMTDDPDADDEMGDVKMHVMDIAARLVLGGGGGGKGGKGGGTAASPGFQTFTHDHSRMIASTWKSDMNRSFAIFDGDGQTKLGSATLDGLAATHPDLSPDDRTLVYVVPRAGTISTAGDHHFLTGSLYTSTFDVAANAIGKPTPLLQAKTDQTFYYPSFSPNGAFLVLNAVAKANPATDDAFYNRRARVALLRLGAGSNPVPIELPALNAPGLGDKLSNSWPKWSPFVQDYRGHKLLWVTFSSNRDYGLHLANGKFDNCYPPESPSYDQPQPLGKKGVTYAACAQPQIWMAAIIVDDDAGLDAKDRSFPAFWLPFQDVNAHNHTAQWVEKVVVPPSSPDGGAPMCVAEGGSCGAGLGACCPDVVCCSASATCVAACVVPD